MNKEENVWFLIIFCLFTLTFITILVFTVINTDTLPMDLKDCMKTCDHIFIDEVKELECVNKCFMKFKITQKENSNYGELGK